MTTTALGNDLRDLFNDFAGKETSYMFQINDVAGGYLKTDPQDPVIAGMQKVAEENNLKLRVLEPGDSSSGNYIPNRINVQLEKGSGTNSKLVVGKMFLG